MKLALLFSRLSGLLTVVGFVLSSATAFAQIISPSAEEVKYSYTATFEIPVSANETTDQERVEFHASHMFGIFHSPEFVESYGISYEVSEGLGGPRSQMKIEILSSEKHEDKIKIAYRNSGKMILHKKAAQAILEKGEFIVPLPNDPYAIYDKTCTDEHYTSFGDYWYFYNPFREGCEHLSKEPFASQVVVKVEPVKNKKLERFLPLNQLRGDNENGDLFSIAVIQGYADNKLKDDEGRQNFKELNQYLLKHDFKLKKVRDRWNPYFIFTKSLTLDNGKTIKVEIKHLLVETSAGSKSKVFAEFFKEATETADVILYGGHSGLGGNLDIPTLEAKAGEFKFNKNKKQIFFFDSCSSYSYYLEHFRVEKTKSKIDILTNGLSSYFWASQATTETMLEFLLNPKTGNPEWMELLNKMESVLEGATYLLSVGGV